MARVQLSEIAGFILTAQDVPGPEPRVLVCRPTLDRVAAQAVDFLTLAKEVRESVIPTLKDARASIVGHNEVLAKRDAQIKFLRDVVQAQANRIAELTEAQASRSCRNGCPKHEAVPPVAEAVTDSPASDSVVRESESGDPRNLRRSSLIASKDTGKTFLDQLAKTGREILDRGFAGEAVVHFAARLNNGETVRALLDYRQVS